MIVRKDSLIVILFILGVILNIVLNAIIASTYSKNIVQIEELDSGITRKIRTKPETSCARNNVEKIVHACQKTLSSSEKLWIAMPSWNNAIGLKKSMESVLSQGNTGLASINVIVFEDFSSNMMSQTDMENYKARMNVTFLCNSRGPRMGSGYGKWKIFQYIRTRALPHEYTLVLDGDDTLSDSKVIRDMRALLHKNKPWFAWGMHNGKYSEQCKPLVLSNTTVKGNNLSIRKNAIWSFCHPRVFQSHLLKHLNESDFQRDSGEWLQKSTDRPFIFKFLEMAGPNRILFMNHRPFYNYTMDHRNGLKVFSKDVINGDKALVNSRPSVPQSSITIHIITCVFDRPNTRSFLDKLLQSNLPPRTLMKIHVCNNNAERQHELNIIAKHLLTKNRLSAAKISIFQMDENFGGYSRFLLARQIMQEEFR